MRILGIDPGDKQTAWVVYNADTKLPEAFGLEPNDKVLEMLLRDRAVFRHTDAEGNYKIYPLSKLAIEMIASYGMAVGKTVFETCVWIGRFIQVWDGTGFPHELIYRKDEKMHLCGTMKAKDANIRQAIMDRYGSTRQAVIGTKKNPGPLYGVSNDVWAALAVAITSAEMERL